MRKLKRMTAFFLAGVMTMSMITGCSSTQKTTGEQEETQMQSEESEKSAEVISINTGISEDKEFGSVILDISGENFGKAGFTYGDSCKVEFSNGKIYEDVPFYSGYYGATNELAVVDYNGNMATTHCYGDSLWKEAGCQEGDSVEITLQEQGTYLLQQEALDLHYSDDRADYEDDVTFANYRAMKGGALKADWFFRGASPLDNKHNRAKITDDLLKNTGVNFVLDLADTDEKIAGYRAEEDFASDYTAELYDSGKVVPCGLTAAYRKEEFANNLTNGLRKMIAWEGPYYIHCTEGKDRTGFACLLLECVAGCSVEEMRQDYMVTYENYYGMTEESDPIKYEIIVEIRFNDMLFWLAGVESEEELEGVSLEEAAHKYLTNNGFTEKEWESLKGILLG